MTIKNIQARFTSGNDISIDKAVVPANEWRMAMAEIQVLKDEYIWKLSEVSQLQEQNTYLYKVSAELQDLCDRQAKRLAQADKQMVGKYEPVLKQALEALEYANPLMECYWGNNASETIAAIKKVLG